MLKEQTLQTQRPHQQNARAKIPTLSPVRLRQALHIQRLNIGNTSQTWGTQGKETAKMMDLNPFFQVPAITPGPNRRSSRKVPLSSTAVPATKILSALMPSPDGYNPELDTLLSCLESKVPPDLCLLSSSRTTALHEAFPADLDRRDPKSQKEIDALSPAEAERYNDATITEFLGMKNK
jgi:hypothetical protein